MPSILSVSEATQAVKEVLEAEFPFLWVRGEIASLSRPASGHLYFTLADGRASLPVVWFKSAQWSPGEDDAGDCVNPVTGEVMEAGCGGTELAEGMEVLVAGRIGVYEPRGVYQLVAEVVQTGGAGELALAFEAMRRTLSGLGYFETDRKRPLPANPSRVAVVTSPSGAALRDFLRLAAERGTGAEIRIHPTLVQGGEAPQRIAAALLAADDGWAEAVALIRGGGSPEDLAAFNSREVADALFAMQTPVVCGVGHEPDISIADLVADVRAATPSHAAQSLWSRREGFAQRLDELTHRLMRSGTGLIAERGQRLRDLSRALDWFSPVARMERLSRSFAREQSRLVAAGRRHLRQAEETLRGEVSAMVRAFGPRETDRLAERLAGLARRMDAAAFSAVSRAGQRLDVARTRLAALDPEAPLLRGYSLVRLADGTFLRSVAEVRPGDGVDIVLADGTVGARVERAEKPEGEGS